MRESFTKLLPLALVFLLALSVSACNMGRDAARNNDATRQGGNMHQAGMEQQRTVDRARNFDQMRENDRFGADRTDMRGKTSAGVHGNTRMEVSQEIADAIAQMEEVSTANVLLTDRNAYVAVMMEDGPHQTNLRGTNRYGNDRADNGLVGTDLHFGGYGAENDVSDRIKEQMSTAFT